MAHHAARAIRQRHRASDGSEESGGTSASSSAASLLSAEQRRALEEAFEAADKNGDGLLSVTEYHDIFQSHGLTIDREWIEKTIARHDRDGDGAINFEEFVEMNVRSRTGKPQPSTTGGASVAGVLERAKLAFNAYDRNRDGYLTKSELRKTSKNMTDAQIEAVFDRYDRNKDGRLDFDEFKDLMVSKKKPEGK